MTKATMLPCLLIFFMIMAGCALDQAGLVERDLLNDSISDYGIDEELLQPLSETQSGQLHETMRAFHDDMHAMLRDLSDDTPISVAITIKEDLITTLLADLALFLTAEQVAIIETQLSIKDMGPGGKRRPQLDELITLTTDQETALTSLQTAHQTELDTAIANDISIGEMKDLQQKHKEEIEVLLDTILTDAQKQILEEHKQKHRPPHDGRK